MEKGSEECGRRMGNDGKETDWREQIRVQPLSSTDRNRERVPAPVI